jgi:hypothetical protein
MKKGKILKIKPGYNPNCSSGAWLASSWWDLWLILISILFGIGVTVASIVISILFYQNSKRKEQSIQTKFGK